MKFFRLLQEAWFAITFYENWWIYFTERCGFFGERIITIRLKNGIIYNIHTNTSDIRVLNELWNLSIYDHLKSLVGENSTIIDIGGHVGVFSVKAATWGKNVRVYSYEPMPQNFNLLTSNVAVNNLDDRIKPAQSAVADQDGNMNLYVRYHDSGGGSLYNTENTKEGFTISVKTVTLENIFKTHNIAVCDFMKIDCEGGEVPILTKAPQELFKKIRSISIEWHEDLAPMSRIDFMKFLEGVEYSVSFDLSTGTIYAEHK